MNQTHKSNESARIEIGSFLERNSNMLFAKDKFPSLFSKSIGFTLCGIAELPNSFLLTLWVK